MTTTVQVNERGTMTLPKAMRQTLGIEKGGVVMAEASSMGILLKPAVAFPIEIYTDKRVGEFDQADEELSRFLSRKGKK